MALPTGYTEVQYIQSTGTQYVDSEVPANSDVRITAEFALLENSESTSCIFGAQGTESKRYVFCAKSSGAFRSDYGTEYITGPAVTLNEHYTVDKNRNLCTLNGTLITCSAATFTGNSNLYIFARSYTSLSPSKIKLYKSSIYVDDILVRDYVPCINPDGEAGLYDTVNSKFYGNAGTGIFIPGPRRVSLPNGYKQLEYIQGTGTQKINTGVTPTVNTKILFGINMTETTGNVIIGNMVNDDNDYRIFNYSGQTYWDIKNSRLIGAVDSFPANTYFNIECGNYYVIQNGVKTLDGTKITEFTSDTSIFALSASVDDTDCAKGILYYLKIYDSTTLVRNFIPCSNPSGAIGLYDLVNSKFYPNAGTGVFTAGPEVTWPSNDAIYVKVNGIWRQIDGIKLL